MALIDKASLLFVPSVVAQEKAFNILPSGNRAPDNKGGAGYDQTRADFTFDRGSNAAATRIGSDGLIKKYRENLLVQSNQFDTTWARPNSSVTSGQSGYDGSNDAWLLSATANFARIEQTNSSNGVVTLSVYAKAGTADWIMLRLTGSGFNDQQYFDLANGTIGINRGCIAADIEDVGGGWYRCSATTNGPTLQYAIMYIALADGNLSPTNENIYIQNAQLESGMVSTTYLDSGATTAKAGVLIDLPRINYDANGENGSLLLEPSRQQLIQYSEYFGAWTLTNSSLIANAITSPEGVSNAYKIVENTALGAHAVYLNNVFTADGTYKTASVFVKAAERTFCAISTRGAFGSSDKVLIFNLTTGEWAVNGSAQNTGLEAEDFGDGWWRIVLNTNTTSGAYDSFIVGSAIAGDTWADAEYTGDGTSGIYVYGAQVEAGSYATSYIPNHGESGGVTRAADSCSVTGASDVIGQTEGTLFAEIDYVNTGTDQNYINISDGTLDNRINVSYNTPLNSFVVFARVGGSTQALMTMATSPSSGIAKIAVAYKLNQYVFYVNGSQIAQDSSALVPTCNSLQIGSFQSFGSEYPVKQALVFKTALTNAELATLTTL